MIILFIYFQTVRYPDDIGYPLGGNQHSKFVRLEVHYNNPKHYEGVKYESGIRLYYTDETKQHSAGILEVGVIYTDRMLIPPLQKSFEWNGVCPGKCTEKVIITYKGRTNTNFEGRYYFL